MSSAVLIVRYEMPTPFSNFGLLRFAHNDERRKSAQKFAGSEFLALKVLRSNENLDGFHQKNACKMNGLYQFVEK